MKIGVSLPKALMECDVRRVRITALPLASDLQTSGTRDRDQTAGEMEAWMGARFYLPHQTWLRSWWRRLLPPSASARFVSMIIP
ncbi:hypothetical protein ABFU52_13005 [Xanthomonas campestris pv. campestris]|uniref:hypothetical protein n=1 Tax=Xanthomonas campestris TaxID=339 RepID=UPI00388E9E7B